MAVYLDNATPAVRVKTRSEYAVCLTSKQQIVRGKAELHWKRKVSTFTFILLLQCALKNRKEAGPSVTPQIITKRMMTISC